MCLKFQLAMTSASANHRSRHVEGIGFTCWAHYARVHVRLGKTLGFAVDRHFLHRFHGKPAPDPPDLFRRLLQVAQDLRRNEQFVTPLAYVLKEAAAGRGELIVLDAAEHGGVCVDAGLTYCRGSVARPSATPPRLRLRYRR